MSSEAHLDLVTEFTRWRESFVGVGIPIPGGDAREIVTSIWVTYRGISPHAKELEIRTRRVSEEPGEGGEGDVRHDFTVGSAKCLTCDLVVVPVDTSSFHYGYIIECTGVDHEWEVAPYDPAEHGAFGASTREEAERRCRSVLSWQSAREERAQIEENDSQASRGELHL
jgi:hypothetical protein